MKVASLAEVKAKLSAYVNDCQSEGPVIITRNGTAVAMLVATGDDEELERLVLSHSPQFREIMDRAEKNYRAGKTVTLTEFRKLLDHRRKQGGVKSKRKRKASA